MPPKPNIQIHLDKCLSEVDITIVDRITALLNPQKLFGRTKQTTSAAQSGSSMGYFNQAMEEGMTNSSRKWELSITSPLLTLNVRFPIPDLRPATEVDRAQWWNRNIRDDILILRLTEARMFTLLDDSNQGWSLDLRCQQLEGLFQENPINPPISFLHACSGNTDLGGPTNLADNDGFDWPRLILKANPPAPLVTLEEQEPDDSDEFTPINSIDTVIHQLLSHDATAEPSPFSTRRVVYESHSASNERDASNRRNADGEPKGEKMVLPGERVEVAGFIEQSTANSQFVIEISLANAHLVFPNKHFYEVVYNRITSDLLLWEPTAPVPTHKDSCNIRPSNFNLNWEHAQDTMNHRFTMCKSTLQFDSSSEEEEDASYFAYEESKQKPKKQKLNASKATRQNKLCFVLNSKRTVITINPPLRDANKKVIPEHCGEMQLHLVDSTFFAVSMAPAETTTGYMCLHINQANVYHKGILQSPPFDFSDIGPANLSTPFHLNPILYRTEAGARIKPMENIGNEMADALMLSVRITLDPVRNMKTFCVALALRGATLRYRVDPSAECCITQFMDFFDVVEYPVLGYRPPEVLTELNLHFWACALDYRPLYLPTRVIFAIESFSVCSNVTCQTTTSVIRIIAEDAYMFLGKKCNALSVDLKQDYVCVMELSFFDIFIKRLENIDPKQKQPQFILMATNNILNLRTCSDSFQAALDLLTYFVKNGDLRDNQSCPSDLDLESALSSLQSEGVSPGSSSESEEKMHGLMEEAMRESLSCAGDRTPPERTVAPDRVILCSDVARERSRRSGLSREMTDSITDYHVETRPSTTQGFDISDDDDEDDYSTDEDFCILENDPGVGIVPRTGEPQIRCLTTKPIVLKENHFHKPIGRTDQLKAPKHYPIPVSRTTFKDISICWYMYGGNDFPTQSLRAPPRHPPNRSMDSVPRRDMDLDSDHIMSDYCQSQGSLPAMGVGGVAFSKVRQGEVRWQPSSPSSFHATRSSPSTTRGGRNWQTRGGPGRRHDVCVELHLNKIRYQFEKYPDDTYQAERHVFLVHEVEVLDRLKSSDYNKFLYQYTSESMPRQSQGSMVLVKLLFLRPDITLPATLECTGLSSFMPLRLNIDQDTINSIIRFFTDSTSSSSGGGSSASPEDTSELSDPASGVRFGSMDSVRSGGSNARLTPRPQHDLPVRTVVGSSAPTSLPCNSLPKLVRSSSSDSQNLLMIFDEEGGFRLGQQTPVIPSATTADSAAANMPIFFRKFTFAHDVPILIDYHGKWVDTEHGTLAGVCFGLGQLNNSEIILKRRELHGVLGVEKLLQLLWSGWSQDIYQKQLSGVLSGVGPLHSLVQLYRGMHSLCWLPVEQYRKDGRILRGLQRGANAFTTSTAMAALELTNRMVQAVQYTAETAYDVVSPGPSVRRQASSSGRPGRKRLSQPADIREGLTNAYNVVCEGLGDTARTLVQVASEEHEHKGITGAVGGVLRQIPSTMVKPIILATEATSNVLGGVQCQMAPHKHKEDQSKFRSSLRDDEYSDED